MRRIVLVLILALPLSASAGDLSLIVSGQWLEKTGENERPALGPYVDFNFDVGGGAGVGLLWQFSNRWALETKASWGVMDATAFLVRPDAVLALQLGELDVVPVTAVVQWRPDLDGDWDPYLGVGAAHILFGRLAVADEKIEFDDDTALVIAAGLDIALSERWFLNGDLKYFPIETGTRGRSVLGESADIRFEPVIGSAGIRFRF